MKSGKRIRYVRLQRIGEEGTPEFITIRAKQFIDCSYEGDLMAAAGISYTVGREDNSIYNETLNGVQLLDKHQFPDSIDPYKEKGNPPSGLCWGISDHPLASKGTGDSSVQAYNYRLCLTNDQQLRRPFENRKRITRINMNYSFVCWRKRNINWERYFRSTGTCRIRNTT